MTVGKKRAPVPAKATAKKARRVSQTSPPPLKVRLTAEVSAGG